MMDTLPPPAAQAKDFLSILDLDHRALERLLDLARQMKADRGLGPKAPTAGALAGRHVALLFEKPSLRTRSTFEIAVRELGAHPLDLPDRRPSGPARARGVPHPRRLDQHRLRREPAQAPDLPRLHLHDQVHRHDARALPL